MTTPLFSRNLRLALGSFEIARHRLSSKNSPKIHRDQERKRRKKRRVSRPWFGKSVPPLTTGHSAKSCQRVINSRISAGIELLRSSVSPPAFNHAVSRSFYLSPSEKQSRNHHCATHTHTHILLQNCKTLLLCGRQRARGHNYIVAWTRPQFTDREFNTTPTSAACKTNITNIIRVVRIRHETKRDDSTRLEWISARLERNNARNLRGDENWLGERFHRLSRQWERAGRAISGFLRRRARRDWASLGWQASIGGVAPSVTGLWPSALALRSCARITTPRRLSPFSVRFSLDSCARATHVPRATRQLRLPFCRRKCRRILRKIATRRRLFDDYFDERDGHRTEVNSDASTRVTNPRRIN